MPNEVDTTVEETTAPTEETKTESTPETEQTDSKDIDYKAELDRLAKDKEEMEKRLAATEFKLRKQDREEKVEQEPVQTGLDAEQVQELLKAELQNVHRTVAAEQARNIASDLTSSVEERDLVMWHYQNSIVPSGNIRDDIESAHLLANRRKFMQEREETLRSLQSRDSASHNSASSSKQTQTPGQEPSLSAKDKQMLASAKMTWNPKNNRWEGSQTFLKLVNDKWESGRIEN